MKRVTYEPSIELDGCKLPIYTTAKSGCYVEILRGFFDQMKAMLSHYSRVLLVGLDLHPKHFSPDNKPVSDFIRKVKKLIRSHYPAYDMSQIGHLWVREKASAEAQHYHVVLILNARAVRSAYRIHSICERIWKGWNQPHPYRAENRTYLIQQDSAEYKDAFAEAFYCYSYYAKEATKGGRSLSANDYSTSRIKPKL